ncbi:hypothetical protein [Thermomonospora umbrina]|uniref:Uncharacterized protein n=1 Tax=Thermomonospora umbrina TaxID=111806 RepID=A0A3D9SQT4_9ACTN|nr:hypothetical protein [Thermomonospora umbrina]REE95295.1 hypothetical protein DFJ69_0678 [Thermomonospora umbrina]
MPGRRDRRTEESLAALRDQLCAEADRHRPDTARMWARIEAALAEPEPEPLSVSPAEDFDAPPPHRRRARRGGLWAVAAGFATATVLGVTSLVVPAMTDRADDGDAVTLGRQGVSGPPPPSPPASPLAGPPVEGTRKNTETGVTAPSTPRPRARGAARPPAGGGSGGSAPILVKGSRDRDGTVYWARNNVTVTVRRSLEVLDVVVRIRRDLGTVPARGWTTLPNSSVGIDTDLTPDAVVYRFSLRPGRRVEPGTYTFAVQYRPGGRHDASGDTYVVRAVGAGGGGDTTAGGHF